MADVEARREARRLKILQNGESRLKRLRNLESKHEQDNSAKVEPNLPRAQAAENNLHSLHGDVRARKDGEKANSERLLSSFNYKDHDYKDHDYKDHDYKDHDYKDHDYKDDNYKVDNYKDDNFKVDNRKDDNYKNDNFKVDNRKADNYKNDRDDDGITTIFQNDRLPYESRSQVSTEQTPTKTSDSYRIWIVVVLAMFVRYVNLVVEKYGSFIEVDVSGLHINKIFVPLILYEMFEYVFIKPEIVNTSFLTTLLVLANVQPRYLHRLVQVFNVSVKFFQDLMVYFFTFLMCDLLVGIVFED